MKDDVSGGALTEMLFELRRVADNVLTRGKLLMKEDPPPLLALTVAVVVGVVTVPVCGPGPLEL